MRLVEGPMIFDEGLAIKRTWRLRKLSKLFFFAKTTSLKLILGYRN